MKYLLDTSIFYELIKTDEKSFQAKLSQTAPGKRFACYYSAIEFNRGLIKSLAELYELIDINQDVPAAFTEFSNRFDRSPKNALIVIAYILKTRSLVNDDPRIFLHSLDAAIIDIADRANSLVKSCIGEFGSNELSDLGIYSEMTNQEFLDCCKNNSDIDLQSFWQKNEKQIQDVFEQLVSKDRLLRDEVDLMLFTQALLSESKYKYDKRDDFVISLDAPKTQTIVSKDKSFQFFAPLLGKTVSNF